MRILALGDVMGKGGRRAVIALAPGLRAEYQVDYVIAKLASVATRLRRDVTAPSTGPPGGRCRRRLGRNMAA